MLEIGCLVVASIVVQLQKGSIKRVVLRVLNICCKNTLFYCEKCNN